MPARIDVPEHLLRRAEAAASLEGKSLVSFVAEALKEKVGRAAGRGSGRRLRFPLVPSASPGSVDLGSEAVARILESEDSGLPAGR